jgi:hypothetical protein
MDDVEQKRYSSTTDGFSTTATSFDVNDVHLKQLIFDTRNTTEIKTGVNFNHLG